MTDTDHITVTFTRHSDGSWLATVNELVGVHGHGATSGEAFVMAMDHAGQVLHNQRYDDALQAASYESGQSDSRTRNARGLAKLRELATEAGPLPCSMLVVGRSNAHGAPLTEIRFTPVTIPSLDEQSAGNVRRTVAWFAVVWAVVALAFALVWGWL